MKNVLFLFCMVLLLSGCNFLQNSDEFSYKLVPVKTGDKWGFIDHIGKIMINPQFKQAYLFSGGLALVQSSDDKYGYIDESGKYAINSEYKYATNFSEGLAFVTPENGFPTCIDKNGKTKFEMQDALEISSFKEGLAKVKIKDKFGYVDRSGKIVISPQFDLAHSFSGSLAAVERPKSNNPGKFEWGFIDKNGKLVINYQFDDCGDFSDGLAMVKNDDGKYGFIDQNGHYVINPQFDGAFDFHEGLAAIKQSGNWGFIDKNGKIIINPQFAEIQSFSNGLAPVRSDKSWGYVDKTGKIAINPQFDEASINYGDFSAVVSNGKIGLIDNTGKYTVNPQYDDIFGYIKFFSWFISPDVLFTVVNDDYFNTDKGINTFLGNSSMTNFKGFDGNNTLKDVISKTANSYNLVIRGDHAITDTGHVAINEDMSIDSVQYYFMDAIYNEIPQYYSGYYINSQTQYNPYSKLASAWYYISLNSLGRGNKKGKILGAAFNKKLMSLYSGSSVPNQENSTAAILARDSATTARLNQEDQTKVKYAFIYSANISFLNIYSDDDAVIIARFKNNIQ